MGPVNSQVGEGYGFVGKSGEPRAAFGRRRFARLPKSFIRGAATLLEGARRRGLTPSGAAFGCAEDSFLKNLGKKGDYVQ